MVRQLQSGQRPAADGSANGNGAGAGAAPSSSTAGAANNAVKNGTRSAVATKAACSWPVLRPGSGHSASGLVRAPLGPHGALRAPRLLPVPVRAPGPVGAVRSRAAAAAHSGARVLV